MKDNTTTELIMDRNHYNKIRRQAQDSVILDLSYENRKELSDFVERTRLRKKITVLFVFVEGILSCAHTDDGKIWTIRKNPDGRMVLSLDNGEALFPMQWSATYEKEHSDPEKNQNVYVSKRDLCTQP